jgi:hypothetical protein
MQSRSGELAMRPLPAVLLDLHEDIVTGRLTLRRGKVQKSVDLVNGNPVSTASTPRDETLGHFLTSTGVITEDQHREAVQRAAKAGNKLGEALIAMQILSVEQLIDQLGKQARHKLVQALRWPQGAWRFEEGGDAIEGMQLRMIDVVLGGLRGLRETAVEDLARLARLDGMAFELTERGRRLKHELKKTFGERALAVLSMGGPIGDIEKALGDRVQARVAIDTMLLCDAIVAKSRAIGLGALRRMQPLAEAVPCSTRSTRPATIRRRRTVPSRSTSRPRRRLTSSMTPASFLSRTSARSRNRARRRKRRDKRSSRSTSGSRAPITMRCC